MEDRRGREREAKVGDRQSLQRADDLVLRALIHELRALILRRLWLRRRLGAEEAARLREASDGRSVAAQRRRRRAKQWRGDRGSEERRARDAIKHRERHSNGILRNHAKLARRQLIKRQTDRSLHFPNNHCTRARTPDPRTRSPIRSRPPTAHVTRHRPSCTPTTVTHAA